MSKVIQSKVGFVIELNPITNLLLSQPEQKRADWVRQMIKMLLLSEDSLYLCYIYIVSFQTIWVNHKSSSILWLNVNMDCLLHTYC